MIVSFLSPLFQRMIHVSLAVLTLMGWLAMIVFAIVPKGLTLSDLVFLYFVVGVMTVTLFAVLDVDLQWVPLTRSVEGSFAMYICRFILIPVQVLMSACVFASHSKAKWKMALLAVILLFFCLEDRVYLWADLIVYRKWNEWISLAMYVVFMVIIGWVARWFTGLDRGGAN